MQKPFATQPELFVTSADLEHPSLQGLDGAEAVLDWPQLERIMASIYTSKTGRPSYQLLTLLRASLPGIWYRLSDVELAQTLFRDLLFRKCCHLELGGFNRQLEVKRIIVTRAALTSSTQTQLKQRNQGPEKVRMASPNATRARAGM